VLVVCVCTGREQVWPLLILVEVGPALVSLLILPLLPETPRYLLLVRQNRDAARQGTLDTHPSRSSSCSFHLWIRISCEWNALRHWRTSSQHAFSRIIVKH